MNRRVNNLIRFHKGKVVRFSELSKPAQLAAAWYMAVDGEAWDLPPEAAAVDMAELRERFPRFLPWLVKYYGKSLWGYVEIPRVELEAAIMQDPDIGGACGSFADYHADYMRFARYEKDRAAKHPREAPWPVILDREHDFETLQDGWHRMHRYHDLRLRTVPALYFPTKAEMRRAARKSQRNPTEEPTLYHGTSSVALAKIRRAGHVGPGYWGTKPVAEYYADVAAEEDGGSPVVIAVPLQFFDDEHLHPDQISIDEPLTYTLGMTEDEVWEAWMKSAQEWQDSWDIVGSVRYDAPVPIALQSKPVEQSRKRKAGKKGNPLTREEAVRRWGKPKPAVRPAKPTTFAQAAKAAQETVITPDGRELVYHPPRLTKAGKKAQGTRLLGTTDYEPVDIVKGRDGHRYAIWLQSSKGRFPGPVVVNFHVEDLTAKESVVTGVGESAQAAMRGVHQVIEEHIQERETAPRKKGKKKRRRNSDGDAFITGEPVAYGPLVKEPRYMLAWSLETTPLCNGLHRDTRPDHRTGSILIQLENGEVLDTDCDNATPVREITPDHEQMFDVVAGATPALRFELCRDYIGPDLEGGVCRVDPEALREIKQRMLEY